MRTNRMLVLIGGLILILGSRLPWISAPVLFGVEGPAFEALEIGWEDSGYITGGIGLILLLIGVFWKGRTGKRYAIPGAILATLAVFVVIGCFYRILEIDPDAGFLAAIDVGIYVTLTGHNITYSPYHRRFRWFDAGIVSWTCPKGTSFVGTDQATCGRGRRATRCD
jgi:hypothetical protein